MKIYIIMLLACLSVRYTYLKRSLIDDLFSVLMSVMTRCVVWQVARMVTKHFQELHQRELRAEREDVQKMKRIASSVAKLVREFWSNIEKVSRALDGVVSK